MAEQGSTGPQDAAVVEWRLTHKRRPETHTYQQTELSIEGEARLLSLVREVGVALTERNVSWTAIEAMLEDGATLEWPVIMDVLGLVAEQAPDLVTDSALVFLGIFPIEEDGTPNTKYEGERGFIKGAINFSRWVEMIRVFTDQNEYRRLAGPFGRALGIRAQSPQPVPALGTVAVSSGSSSDSSTSSPDPATAPPDSSSDPSAGASSAGI